MRPKSIILLVLALGCGLVAAVGINQVMASRDAQPVVEGEKELILVANVKIDVGELLTAKNCNLEPWPKEVTGKIKDTINKLEDAEGKRAQQVILPGEPIVKDKIGTGQGAAKDVPPGMVVVSVKVDVESSNAGMIQAGDRVDMLVYLNANPSGGVVSPTTKTVLQSLKVFAVDNIRRPERPEDKEEKIVAKTISLIVTPQDAELVNVAKESGKISFALRNPEDNKTATPGGRSVADILRANGGNSAAPGFGPDKPAGGNALLDLLANKNKQPEPKVDVPEPKPQPVKPADTLLWSVVIRSGPSEIREYEFHKGKRLPVEVASANPGGEAGHDAAKADKLDKLDGPKTDKTDKDGKLDKALKDALKRADADGKRGSSGKDSSASDSDQGTD